METLLDLTTITWSLVALIALLTLWYHGPAYSRETVNSAPSILTGFGIFGTFVGIAFGLMGFDSSNIEASVPAMIDGLGVAVWSSVLGILGALSIRLRHSIFAIRNNKKQPAIANVTVADLDRSLHSTNEQLLSQFAALRQENESNHEALLVSNRDYQDRVVQANTDAFVSALSKVMEDFNSRIEVQYGDNFKKFNLALGHLLEWQKSYSSQMDEMLKAQQASVAVIEKATESYDTMIEHSREFNQVAASLGDMLKGLEFQTKDLESYLSGMSGLVSKASEGLPALNQYITELTDKLRDSIEENNRSLTEVLSKAAVDISGTVERVTISLADSVNDAHGGLAEHVKAMTDKSSEQMALLDESMEKELTSALQTFGYQLTALSEKFVNDYTPLTDRLKEVVKIAELKQGDIVSNPTSKASKPKKQTQAL